jgi:hypothetical protein
MVGSYARTIMTGRNRTTKPLSPELRALRVELREAAARGLDPARPLYKAMGAEAKQAFLRDRAA